VVQHLADFLRDQRRFQRVQAARAVRLDHLVIRRAGGVDEQQRAGGQVAGGDPRQVLQQVRAHRRVRLKVP
jgi:hypothetical protein